MKPNAALGLLRQVFTQITDPRGRKGTQHPYAGIVALVFLGLLCRIREIVPLRRWAESHWDLLKEPLGFTSDRPPHDTTISRALAKLSLAELRDAFSTWIKIALKSNDPLWIAAVDGKTSKQGLDAESNPVHMLNVFLQEIKVAIDQWPVGDEKTNEPTLLARRVEELLKTFPMLTLLTGDAIFMQRPLLRVLKGCNCDFLFQVKANQAELLEALRTTFADTAEKPPHHETTVKKGVKPKSAGYGPTCATPSIYVTL
jgi:hypothetical protein